jgi:thioredoxin 1
MAKKVIKFYANWCGPCKAYAPIFEEVTKDLEGFEVINVNLDEDTDGLAAEYNVRSIPHTVMVSDKGAKKHFSGLMSGQELKKFLV